MGFDSLHRRRTIRLTTRCDRLARAALLLLSASFFLSCPACSPDHTKTGDRQDVAARRRPDLLRFPADLHMADASVNAFVKEAMLHCASGDYDRFRLLWSAKEEPLPRGDYEQGWQAVQKIAVRALRKVMLAADAKHRGDPSRKVYVLLAEVALDPTHRAGAREPIREVVLMIVREQGAWRLAHPPKAMRAWIKTQIKQIDPTDGSTEIESVVEKRTD